MDNNLTNRWNNCLLYIKDNVDENQYETWFKDLVAISYTNNTLTIGAPQFFYYETIISIFKELFETSIARYFSPETKVNFEITVDHNDQEKGKINISNENTQEVPQKNKSGFDSNLKSTLTYENFIEGDCNRLCFTIGLNIASSPKNNHFSPLFIYGKPGVGKTHIANAIGKKTLEFHPQSRVLYVSANIFQQQYTEAAKNGQINDFMHFYQSIDVLIIDDIQELGEGNKKGTQETLFHIFNHLHQQSKTIIFTSDKAPKELAGFNERFITRFSWGVSAEITLPNIETRKKIIQAKVERDGIMLTEDTIDYIASVLKGNIRNIEGTLVSLLAYSTSLNININDRGLIDKVIGNITNITPKENNSACIEDIRDIVCEELNVTVEDLNSKSRKQNVVQARQISMYFSKKITNYTTTKIGEALGHRNHATVLHSCTTVENLKETSKSFKSLLDKIEQQLQTRL